MKAKNIVKIIYKHFPKKYALKWDYIGYGSGTGNSNVSKVLIAFEVTSDVIDYAILKKCNMIISHHPMYWGATKKEILKTNPVIKKLYDKLRKGKITHYSPHTAVDGAKNGLNRWYLDILKVDKVKWLSKDIVQIGYFNKAKKFKSIIKKYKKEFQINALLTNFSGKTIKSVMLASGSHDIETIELAKKHKVDLLISGEIKHSSWVYANEINVKILLVGHHMESIYPEYVKKIIKKDIKIEVIEMPQENIIKAV